MAVKDSIPCRLLDSPKDLEVISISISTHNPLVLCTVYLPPNLHLSNQLNLLNYLDSLVKSNSHVIILGDFNVPDVCWSTLSGVSTFSKAFCEFVFTNNLSQLVFDPTHNRGNILDLVLTNSEEVVRNLSVLADIPQITSDHLAISVSFALTTGVSKKSPTIWAYDYSKDNFEGLWDYQLDADF